MQIVEIEAPFNEIYCFYCPVTGQQILSEDNYEASPAMMGCWITLAPGDPMDVHPELEEAWSAFLENEDVYEVRKFLETTESHRLVAFEINSSGMACGPVSNTSWIVIDMLWSNDKAEA